MENKKNINLESELLNDNLEIIYPLYLSFQELITEYNTKLDTDDEIDSEVFFYALYDNAIQHWKKIYSKFALDPIKDEITNIFIKALKTDYKLKVPSKFEEKIYTIHYYILQYFSIGIMPYYEHDDFPNLSLNTDNSEDLNLLLYELFEDLWCELEIDTLIDDELFDDRSEFYNIEVKLLSDVLSKCWNEAKSLTNIKAKGILVEATAVGETYSLDDNTVLKDFDPNEMF